MSKQGTAVYENRTYGGVRGQIGN